MFLLFVVQNILGVVERGYGAHVSTVADLPINQTGMYHGLIPFQIEHDAEPTHFCMSS
jgi:hypothetical protein